MKEQSISESFLDFIKKNRTIKETVHTISEKCRTFALNNNCIFMNRKKVFIILCLISLLLVGLVYYIFLAPISTSSETVSVNIDNNDTSDSVWTKIDSTAHPRQLIGLKSLSALLGYSKHIHSGHYEILTSTNSVSLMRKLKNGRQDPLLLTIPEARTKEQLAEKLSHRLMMSADSLLAVMNDSVRCAWLGTDTANVIGMFLANSYEVYWNLTPAQLMERMKREWDTWWTIERKQSAANIGLTPAEVITLASIVDEETSNNNEKPTIAGMYLNRLHSGIPLQADPTVKFALRRFELRRIYHEMLKTPSPYNTYMTKGLPPGPIRIPSAKGIESVLHAEKHDYMYMCAKEDFSGKHNFAKTFTEHLDNAKRYSMALNKRGIQ